MRVSLVFLSMVAVRDKVLFLFFPISIFFDFNAGATISMS